MSILIQSHFPELKDWQLEILGTDINHDFLKRAKQAHYRKWSFRNNSEDIAQRYFQAQDKIWELNPQYRQGVRFQYHNLKQGQFNQLNPLGFDLILCRNVLIYFDLKTQNEVLQGFHQALSSAGWLVLGAAELSPLNCAPFHAHELSKLSCFSRSPNQTNLTWPLKTQTSTTKVLPQALFPAKTQTLQVLPKPYLQTEPQPTPKTEPIPPSHPETQQNPQILEKIKNLADQGCLSEAESLCHQWIGEMPLEISAQFYLGLILSAAEQLDKALTAFQKALYLDRQNPLLHYHLGLIQQRQNNATAASKAFQNAERLLHSLADEAPLISSEEITAQQLKGLLKLQQRELT